MNSNAVAKLLLKRLDIGRERYGHGVQVGADTRQWGTPENDWFDMMFEELLDGMIYCAANHLRYAKDYESTTKTDGSGDDNDAIITWIFTTLDRVEKTDMPANAEEEILRNLFKSVVLALSAKRKRARAHAAAPTQAQAQTPDQPQ